MGFEIELNNSKLEVICLQQAESKYQEVEVPGFIDNTKKRSTRGRLYLLKKSLDVLERESGRNIARGSTLNTLNSRSNSRSMCHSMRFG